MTPWTCTGKQKVFFKKSHAAISDTYSLNSYVLTLPLHYQILIIKSSSLIQLKNEIVLTFVV